MARLLDDDSSQLPTATKNAGIQVTGWDIEVINESMDRVDFYWPNNFLNIKPNPKGLRREKLEFREDDSWISLYRRIVNTMEMRYPESNMSEFLRDAARTRAAELLWVIEPESNDELKKFAAQRLATDKIREVERVRRENKETVQDCRTIVQEAFSDEEPTQIKKIVDVLRDLIRHLEGKTKRDAERVLEEAQDRYRMLTRT